MATTDTIIPCVTHPILMEAVINSVQDCLMMFDVQARCVGVSSVPLSDQGEVTGMIGVHGDVSGFITTNLSECAAMSIVGRMLQDQFEALSSDVLDGAGEMTNIIAGGIKKRLVNSRWHFQHITVPSVIIGQNYQITYSGLEFLAVAFELTDTDFIMMADRIFKVTLSILQQ